MVQILHDKVGTERVNYSELAAQWQQGDREAGNVLLSALDNELRVIASAKLRGERNCSLATGDLVNEALLKLSYLDNIELNGRAHILALVSRLMRQVLIDAARKRHAAKRDGLPVTLCTDIAEWEIPIDVMALDLALKQLAEVDPQRAEIVEMRFFGGMSSEDIAVVLHISEATVKRRWKSTRAWLHKQLGRAGCA